jgi:cell division transport system permease protein
MAKQEEKYAVRKLRSSYLSTVISVALVLFMLGLLGLIILNAKKLSNYVKENIGFTVILNDSVKEVEVAHLQKVLDATSYVKSTEYINKQQAALNLQKDLGEDFVSFLGYNPLRGSIEVRLNADYANSDSLIWIEKDLMKDNIVKEVYYQKSLVSLVNENVKKIGLVIILFSAMLMIVSIALINNSIRLSIYARRFLIRTMLLVGATGGFIRRPFVLRGIRHGLYGAVIAILLLVGVLYLVQQQLPELFQLQDEKMIATLFALVIALGIIITWISTWLAVHKYLRLKTDELYY